MESRILAEWIPTPMLFTEVRILVDRMEVNMEARILAEWIPAS